MYSNIKQLSFPRSFDPTLYPLAQRLLDGVDAPLDVRTLPSLSHAGEVHLVKTVGSKEIFQPFCHVGRAERDARDDRRPFEELPSKVGAKVEGNEDVGSDEAGGVEGLVSGEENLEPCETGIEVSECQGKAPSSESDERAKGKHDIPLKKVIRISITRPK
jgi:hypothetical protein